MSETPGPAARRALPPRDDEREAPTPRRLAAQAPAPAPEPAAPEGGSAAEAPDVATPDTPDTPTEPVAPPRTPPRRLALVAGAVAAAALVVVLVLALTGGGGILGLAPTPTPTFDRTTLLATPTDLGGLRAGTTWTETATATKVEADTPQPRCLAPAADTTPRAASSLVRTLAAQGGDAASALHQLDHYATAEDATAAFGQRVIQLGACARSTAWLTRAAGVQGVAEAGIGVTYVFQDAQSEFHTILVTRSGADVGILDLSSANQAWPREAAAAAVATLGTRQCAATAGTCPGTVQVTDQVPPPGEPAGWLASVDLPRLTPGAGTWRGTDVTPLRLPGAACEAVDLANVAGATSAQQRTYLLNDDTRADKVGVDEAVYTFATPAEASALVATLTTNVDGCPGRTATATVKRTGELSGPTGAGPSWAITQKVNGDQTAMFRVSVVAAGTRVVYLFGNPTATVDFSDGDWQAVVNRAAARLAQLP